MTPRVSFRLDPAVELPFARARIGDVTVAPSEDRAQTVDELQSLTVPRHHTPGPTHRGAPTRRNAETRKAIFILACVALAFVLASLVPPMTDEPAHTATTFRGTGTSVIFRGDPSVCLIFKPYPPTHAPAAPHQTRGTATLFSTRPFLSPS